MVGINASELNSRGVTVTELTAKRGSLRDTLNYLNELYGLRVHLVFTKRPLTTHAVPDRDLITLAPNRLNVRYLVHEYAHILHVKGTKKEITMLSSHGEEFRRILVDIYQALGLDNPPPPGFINILPSKQSYIW